MFLKFNIIIDIGGHCSRMTSRPSVMDGWSNKKAICQFKGFVIEIEHKMDKWSGIS